MADLSEIVPPPEGTFYRLKYPRFGIYELQLREPTRFSSRILESIHFFPDEWGEVHKTEDSVKVLSAVARALLRKWGETRAACDLESKLTDHVGNHPPKDKRKGKR